MALKRFEEVLGASKSGYLVGDQITYPDLVVLHPLRARRGRQRTGLRRAFALPHCGAFLDRMARGRTRRLLASPRRMPVRARPSGSSGACASPGARRPRLTGDANEKRVGS